MAAETKNYKIVSAMLSPEQVLKLRTLRQREQKAAPHRRVSFSDIMREVIGLGLPIAEREVARTLEEQSVAV